MLACAELRAGRIIRIGYVFSRRMATVGFEESQVVIVGAGPSGTATAVALAQLGVSGVTLLDAHDFPRDKTCGSGLSFRAIEACKQLGVWDEIAKLSYPIRGVRLVTPGGYDEQLTGGTGDTQAVVCLRRHMDYALLKRAQQLGVNFVPHIRVREPVLEGERWVGVRGRKGETFRARHIVVADGAHSTFTFDPRPKRLIHTVMGWWSGIPFTPHHLEMIFDPSIRPYYGWLFPEAEDRVNIGITYEDDGKLYNARERFTRFLDRHYEHRLRSATPIGRWQGHPISYAYTLRDLWSPGRVIVGEAGRMTHPLTGEGIAQALRSGKMAGEALASIINNGVDETQALRRYQRRCQWAFSGSQAAGGLLRGLMRTPALDWLVRVTTNSRIKNAAAVVLTHV